MNWYDTLEKSSLTPPSIIFSLVWPILYLLMFIGFAMVLSSNQSPIIILIFILQIGLNLSWSPIFFQLHNIQLALYIIGLLFLSVLVMTYMFYQQNTVAGLLQGPYILWLGLAFYLNWYIYKHN